jgi:hypothetical protein
VATTRGNKTFEGCQIEGRDVVIGVNAYIYPD